MIAKTILALWGWQIRGAFPRKLTKYIIVVAPHDKGLPDFMLGILVRLAQKVPNSHFLIKEEMMRNPILGFLLHIMGAIPINRKKGGHRTPLVSIIKKSDKFTLGITPEGTRKKGVPWHTGFHRIALEAEVPIILLAFDYHKKVINISNPMMQGNYELDRNIIMSWYQDKINYRVYEPNIPRILG